VRPIIARGKRLKEPARMSSKITHISRRFSVKKSMVLVVFVFLSFLILSTGIAQQKADEKVVCPVSGETMLKSQAKASYEYEGKTYYFCCDDCKEKFVKDPAKYIGKNAAMKDVYACPMHPDVQSDQPGKCPKCGMTLEKRAMPMTHGQGMTLGHGGMEMKGAGACPMMGMMSLEGAVVVSENTKDGVTVRISAKDPETVKKIQAMGAKINEMHGHK
jgi:YHS domain-containing protein